MPGITLRLSIICFSVDQKDIVSLKDLQKPQINFVVCFSAYYNKQFGFWNLFQDGGFKETCGRREFNIVCLEVQHIRLVQDKGIILAL